MATFRICRTVVFFLVTACTLGFAPEPRLSSYRKDQQLTVMELAKKMRNKQAELAKKMALAKKQKDGVPGEAKGVTKGEKLSAKEMKEKNDRLRFEELLQKQTTSLNSVSSDGYLNKQQEDEEIRAYTSGVDRLFEGDPAPTKPFEELISIKSENALGEMGTKRLIPWLRNSNLSDYIIIICDPRVKSPELRDTARSLFKELPKDLLSRTVIINADTPAENRRWMKKSNVQDVNILSDEKREWMRGYTALGENRWSMTMFVLADERVQKIAREMETIGATKVVRNAVESMESRRL